MERQVFPSESASLNSLTRRKQSLALSGIVRPAPAPVAVRNATSLPLPTAGSSTADHANIASTSYSQQGDAIQDMLARRFMAQKIELGSLRSRGAYADICFVRGVQAICQPLGVNARTPNVPVAVGNLRVTFVDIRVFLNLTASFGNILTFYNRAVDVRRKLKNRVPATLLVKEALLLRQLDLMFGPQPISKDDPDPVAAEATTIARAALHRELREYEQLTPLTYIPV